MKLNYSIIFVIIFIFNGSAQITIRDDGNLGKSIPPKLIPYDSLSNISPQYKYADFRKYIGYKLFFRPTSKKYKRPEFYSGGYDFLFSRIPELGASEGKNNNLNSFANQVAPGAGSLISGFSKKIKKTKSDVYEFVRVTNSSGEDKFYTKPEAVEGKYFTILDIKVRTNDNPEAGYQKLEDVEISKSKNQYDNETSSFDNLWITLRNESNQDILYWKTKPTDFEYSPFFIVAYFEKLQKIFSDKNLVTTAKMSEFNDVKTGEKLDLSANETWHCYEVSFSDPKDYPYLRPYLYLKNITNEHEIQLEIEKGFNIRGRSYNKVGSYNFLLESDFVRMENIRKQKELEEKNNQLEEEKRIKEEKIKLKNSYVKKYGAKMGALIAEGKVVLGMNKEMCKASWGEPSSVNRSVYAGLTTEQWVYNMQTYLYFSNGILKTIQD